MSDLKAILDKMTEVRESQIRTEEKLNATHENVNELKNRVGIQNGRIGKLEDWRNYLIGAWAVIAVVLGFIAKFILG